MSRREKLEQEIVATKHMIESYGKDMPKVLLNAYRKQLDNISFELNTLYGEMEVRQSSYK